MRIALVATCCFLSVSVNLLAADSPIPPNVFDLELKQQELRQQSDKRKIEASKPDMRLLNQQKRDPLEQLSEESNCFQIISLKINNIEKFSSLDQSFYKGKAEGLCLGEKGINALMSDIQNKLVDAGLITTRVLIPPQDLSSGNLALEILEGKLALKKSNSSINLNSNLPSREGEVLDLRDIEQGLENLQRLPTVNVDIQIEPSEKAGESNLLVNWQQTKKWRAVLALDDAGSESTGKTKLTATAYIDNLFGLSDQFDVSVGTNAPLKSKLGNKSYSVNYSFPWQYWLASLSYSNYSYKQTVAGLNEDIEYSGESTTSSFNLSRVVRRTSKGKTTISMGLTTRESKNFIEDVEVEVQRRKTAYATLGVKHRQFIGPATLDTNLTVRKGLDMFGAIDAPESATNSGTALSTIVLPEISVNYPFKFLQQNWRYSGRLSGQWTSSKLTTQDRFSIGGRYTVRGFDGNSSLSADKGVLLRNDISLQIPNTNQEVYLGLDYGEVSGSGSEYLAGKKLAGTVLGMKGSAYGFGYDVFVGKPIKKPTSFNTTSTVAGFSINLQF